MLQFVRMWGQVYSSMGTFQSLLFDISPQRGHGVLDCLQTIFALHRILLQFQFFEKR